MWQRGLRLGPSAQWLSDIVCREGEALGRLRDADEEETEDGQHLHPGLLDSALQLLFACRPAAESRDQAMILLEIEDYHAPVRALLSRAAADDGLGSQS